MRSFPIPKFELQNVVASASLGTELDLNVLALSLEGADYDPEQVPGLIYRLKDPKTARLLFRSGKVVCTGGKNLESMKKQGEIIIEVARNLGGYH